MSRSWSRRLTGLESLNIAKKWFSKTYAIQGVFVGCICRSETTKTGRKNARNLKKIQLQSDDDIS